MNITDISGLTVSLSGKQATIADGDLTIAKTTGLQAALDSKQATITDASLTIARTNGLQAALDSKAPLANPTLTGTPTAPTATAGTNTIQLATTAFVRTEVSNMVDSAPAALDTLNELAAALGDDENFSTTMTNALAGKQATIADGDLTIARTNGLQAALDAKAGSTSLINLKPTITIPELSTNDLLLNFTEGIKDVATYDKADFTVTNKGVSMPLSSIDVLSEKVKLIIDDGSAAAGGRSTYSNFLFGGISITNHVRSVKIGNFIYFMASERADGTTKNLSCLLYTSPSPRD